MDVIRPATSGDDWAQAAALLREYAGWLDGSVGVDPLEVQPWFRTEIDDLRGHYAGDRARLFVAARGDGVVGTAAVRCDDEGGAELKRVYVSPTARGSGVVDRLIRHVLAFARVRDCTVVWLESLRGAMDPAIAVYRRNGFEVVAESGRSSDLDGLVVMERPLRVLEPV